MLGVQFQKQPDHCELRRQRDARNDPVGQRVFVDHLDAHQTFVKEEVDHYRQRNAGADQGVRARRFSFMSQKLAGIILTPQYHQTQQQEQHLCAQNLGQHHEGVGRQSVAVKADMQAVVLPQQGNSKNRQDRDDDQQGRCRFFGGTMFHHRPDAQNQRDRGHDDSRQHEEGRPDQRNGNGGRIHAHCGGGSEANGDHREREGWQQLRERVVLFKVKPTFCQHPAKELGDVAKGQNADQKEGQDCDREQVFNHAPKIGHENQPHDEGRIDRHCHRQRHRLDLGLGV